MIPGQKFHGKKIICSPQEGVKVGSSEISFLGNAKMPY